MAALDATNATSADMLDHLADAADAVATDQRDLARKARTAGRRRRQGWSLSRILDQESKPGMLALLARSARRLTDASGFFRKAVADGLAEEGLSTRAIAHRLGVSHQRVSAMRTRGGAAGTDADEKR